MPHSYTGQISSSLAKIGTGTLQDQLLLSLEQLVFGRKIEDAPSRLTIIPGHLAEDRNFGVHADNIADHCETQKCRGESKK